MGCNRNDTISLGYNMDAQNEWVITQIVLEETFLFKGMHSSNATTLAPYYVWDHAHEDRVLQMHDFLDNIIDLVGFRGENIYTLAMAPMSGVAGWTGWYQTLSQINYTERSIVYSMHGLVSSFFQPETGVDFGFNMYFCNQRNITLFFHIDSRAVSNNLHFSNTVVLAQWHNSCTGTELLPSILHQFYTHRRPFVAHTSKHIILNYIEDGAYVLGYMRNVPNSTFVEVVRYPFIINSDGSISGRIPIYAAGDEHGIYFQVITLENGHLDFDGTSAIYRYCFEAGGYSFVMALQDSITYINAHDGVIIFNYHSVNDPTAQTGRIVCTNTDSICMIPHITPVNDIIYSSFDGNFVYIATNTHALVYNLQTKQFAYFDISEISPLHRSNIRIHYGYFGWLCFEDDVVFYRARFKIPSS